MDAIDAIMTRRSIRRYSDQPVTDAEIETVLRAAMVAPSAFNERSTRFVVVRDPEVRARLAAVSKYSGPAGVAPVDIVVCGETAAERYPGTYWVQDGVAALENLLIAANAIGLGAVWMGVHPWEERVEAVREAVGLPEGIEPLAHVALGHPAESKEPADRFDPASVHADRW
jgi:nitroreductase